MKYIIREGKLNGKYNAINKARTDCEKIFENNGFKLLNIKSKYPIHNNKLGLIKQFYDYSYNDREWTLELNNLKQGDIVAIQFPLMNKCSNISKIIRKFNKKILFILLIHDIDSIRYKSKESELKIVKRRREKEEINLINNCHYVIVHNYIMKKELIKMGVTNPNMIELGLFDYLIPNKKFKESNSDSIIIAGNLSPGKAKYIKELYKIKKINFSLYGVGYEKQKEDNNIEYKGSFLPDELPFKLEGKFGLVWDGNAINSCTGIYGEYLKYNNPHKLSLYLVSGIPVIVWKKSAMSKFVLDNKLGFAVDNLFEIDKVINNISKEEYNIMKNNCKKISKKLSEGYYLTKSINDIIK